MIQNHREASIITDLLSELVHCHLQQPQSFDKRKRTEDLLHVGLEYMKTTHRPQEYLDVGNLLLLTFRNREIEVTMNDENVTETGAEACTVHNTNSSVLAPPRPITQQILELGNHIFNGRSRTTLRKKSSDTSMSGENNNIITPPCPRHIELSSHVWSYLWEYIRGLTKQLALAQTERDLMYQYFNR